MFGNSRPGEAERRPTGPQTIPGVTWMGCEDINGFLQFTQVVCRVVVHSDMPTGRGHYFLALSAFKRLLSRLWW